MDLAIRMVRTLSARNEGGPEREGRRRAWLSKRPSAMSDDEAASSRVLHSASPHPECRRRNVQPRACVVRRAWCGRSDRVKRLRHRRFDDAQCRAGGAAGRRTATAQSRGRADRFMTLNRSGSAGSACCLWTEVDAIVVIWRLLALTTEASAVWIAAAQNGPVAYSASRIFLISLAA